MDEWKRTFCVSLFVKLKHTIRSVANLKLPHMVGDDVCSCCCLKEHPGRRKVIPTLEKRYCFHLLTFYWQRCCFLMAQPQPIIVRILRSWPLSFALGSMMNEMRNGTMGQAVRLCCLNRLAAPFWRTWLPLFPFSKKKDYEEWFIKRQQTRK